MLRFSIFAAALALSGFAHAQTAPSASDIASYSGLHLAAHEGSVDDINQLVAEGADIKRKTARAARQPMWPPLPHTTRL